jgi:hypothetical protein
LSLRLDVAPPNKLESLRLEPSSLKEILLGTQTTRPCLFVSKRILFSLYVSWNLLHCHPNCIFDPPLPFLYKICVLGHGTIFKVICPVEHICS